MTGAEALERLADEVPRPDRYEVWEAVLWLLAETDSDALADAVAQVQGWDDYSGD